MSVLNTRKIVVVGCGKLGAPLVGCLANSGHEVIGIDINEKLIKELNTGVVTWNEPGLKDLLVANMDRIKFQSSFHNAFSEAEMTFVIVPTPSLENGEFSNEFVIDAVSQIGREVSKSDLTNHIVVIVSTVMPGSTRGVIKDALIKSAGGNFSGLQICYSPEFIALGTVIRNMQYPDIILIGEEDKNSGELLLEVSMSIALNEPKVFRLTLEEAEISKIAINSFVTTKISFSNQISEICERTKGTSAKNVLAAIGSDTRIGQSYLSSGTSYGGPCFPRDNRAFAKYASSIGLRAELSIATDGVNIRQNDRVLRIVEKLVPPGAKILVVGIAYKPDTDVVEESPALAFIQGASNLGLSVDAIDEFVSSARVGLAINVTTVSQLMDSSYDAAILFVPSKNYVDIPESLSSATKIIDLWGLWENCKQGSYTRLGDYFA